MAIANISGNILSDSGVSTSSLQPTISLTTTGTSGAATLVGATLNIPNYGSSLTGYVPYTGASTDVDLGTNDLTSRYLTANGNSGAALGGVVNIKQDAVYIPKGNGYSSIASSFVAFDFFGYTGASTYKNFTLRFDGLTDNTLRTYTLPDASGTLALGTGTTNFISKWTGSGTLGNTSIYEGTSGFISIGNTNSTYNLDVTGTGRFSSNLNVIFSNTSGVIDNNAFLRLVNTGTSTLNQSVDIVMRWQDGTYNGTGGISMVRESATARSGKLILQPIDSSGNNVSALVLASTGAATFSSSVTANGNSLIYSSTTLIDSNGQLGILTTDAVAIDKGGQIMMGGVYTGTTKTAFGGMAAKKENATDGNYAGYLQFITSTQGVGNTEKMRITSAGNVGIGTTSPQGGAGASDRTLSINSGSGAASFVTGLVGDVKYSTLFTASSIVVLETNAAIPLAFNTNATERMRITSGGNVGIGTTSPANKLDINQVGSAYNSVSGVGLKIYGDAGNDVSLALSQTGRGTFYLENLSAGSIPSDVRFRADVASNFIWMSNSTERMRITSGGNVLIGTTNNYNKLTVGSDGADVGITLTTTYNGAVNSRWGVSNPSVTNDAYIGTVANNSFYFITANTERMRITSGGNVGIGTTSPTARLDLGNNVGSANTANQIALYSVSGTALYGFGVSAAQLNYISGGNHSFYNSATTSVQMTITSGGNVLIGTTTDNGATLQVNGTVTTGGQAWKINNASAGSVLVSSGGNVLSLTVNGTTYYIPIYTGLN